jgi:SAM-dependent methyltransferase
MLSAREWVRNNVFSRYKQIVAPGEIHRYLADSAAPKLNIGSGGNRLPGWLNVDLFPAPKVSFMNGARRWPFADGTFHAVLCEHVIEHVPKATGRHFISEAFRTLKPGTKLRVVTPDLEFFAGAVRYGAPEAEPYLHFLSEFTKASQPLNWCDAINLNFYEHGHRYIYTPAELRKALAAEGFVDIVQMRAGNHTDEIFRDVDGHTRLVGLVVNSIEAFALEALKPA